MSATSAEVVGELVQRPQSFEEIQSRPDYRAPLDHTVFALKRVLADYHFAKEIPCGLKSCRQPHKHGYLVLTDGGGETNIGQKCGKTHFGEDVFNSARDDYLRRRERQDLIARAKHLQSVAGDIAAKVKAIAYDRHGAKWALRVKSAMEGAIGFGLVDSLRVATLRGDLAVVHSRRRSDEEVEDLLATNRGLTRERAQFVDERIGELHAMEFLTFDFQKRLMDDLLGPLSSFKVLDPDATPSPKLKTAMKPFENYEKVLEEAANSTASALRFLSDDNLRLLAEWIPKHIKGAAAALRDWIGSKAHLELLLGAPK